MLEVPELWTKRDIGVRKNIENIINIYLIL
jgi:hypothetical protein